MTTAGLQALDRRDPRRLADDAPLLAAYLACDDRRQAGTKPFHTPGHKTSTALTGTVVAGDYPLAGGLDTIKFQHGLLEQAEALAARAWGADFCRFSACGSTHCNEALSMSIGRPGDSVVVSRTLHRSLLIGLVLAGLRPIWVEPEISNSTGLPTGYRAEVVAASLAKHPETCAVFLSDPSYVGTFSDIAAHARVAHDAGVPLLVDAAWAAHFGFHPDLPPHALASGADALVTSAHKTLPAYSQAALLIARTERLDSSRLTRAFDALHTTSPAGSIMASIDASRALLERDGEALLGGVLSVVSAARDRLRAVPGVEVLEGAGVDPMKLAVSIAGTGAHGVEVEAELEAAGVPVELADRDTIVALVTIADDEESVTRFTDELIAVLERRRASPRRIAGAAGWIVTPHVRVDPREAFFGQTETVPFEQSAGRVSAELIALYPPGVPILAPGEEITPETQATLRDAKVDGVRVAYAIDPTLATVEVLT